MSSLCSPGCGFAASKLHNSPCQPTGRNTAVKFSNSAKFGQSNQHRVRTGNGKLFQIQGAPLDGIGQTINLQGSFEETKIDDHGGGGDGGNGRSPVGGGGEGDDGNGDEDEFGPTVKYGEILSEAESRGATLPADMLEAAKSTGLRRLIVTRYLELQGSAWPLGFLMRHCSWLRNRMLADPSFLFKVGAEVVIDFCCVTYAEVTKRGEDFWAEVELYGADLLVGLALDIALVGLLAPCIQIGKKSVSSAGILGRLKCSCAALPGSVFEAERPGTRFSLQQRIAAYFYKGVLYGAAGFWCGLIGQGFSNMIMTAKRSIKKSDDDIPVPPLMKSAVLWGVFLAGPSNTRYQLINGLESLVESSSVAKQAPPVAMAFTVGLRSANNIYGGMQFVEWAKWSGVQ